MAIIGLILGGAGLLSGCLGGFNMFKAENDKKTANQIRKDMETTLNTAVERLNHQRTACGKSLENYGEEKAYILNHSIREFLEVFSTLKHVNFKNADMFNDLTEIRIEQKDFEQLRNMVDHKEALNQPGVEEALKGGAAGAALAFGAYGATQAFACASTGTAISALSGAAATNATLSFLGGGSLAAGGLGIAGGTAVLGGLIGGPMLLLLGAASSKAASKNLEKAKIDQQQAEAETADMEKGSLECEAIRRRTCRLYNVLARLDSRLLPLVYEMEEIVRKRGRNYLFYPRSAKRRIADCVSLAVAVATVIDTPILTEDGKLTAESEDAVEKMEDLLNTL